MNEMPSVGENAPNADLISSVDGKWVPRDSVPENTEKMTGGTQKSGEKDVQGSNKELGVGELEGAKYVSLG
jgi:hypothetical protein